MLFRVSTWRCQSKGLRFDEHDFWFAIKRSKWTHSKFVASRFEQGVLGCGITETFIFSLPVVFQVTFITAVHSDWSQRPWRGVSKMTL